ncbi:uncharacterized protein LOC107224699 [Neodiprion lecontei]|uniref:Uncharacterized protein LOC107224699 n=1 Tax=Neodiprion lecontei TaxID=441921 RepID=A0A6J0BZE5_NEOLC|nr:uncharacterized protein LOC107224699 [Neodiprion lecontei]XP_046586312.1 uncharacterized protein LOC107224699 [Neodiprion lecontei]XP_046586313.1 uncharacterized protein LOC107224699 [Neodiprion lecontei]XP_046586314.1 uncharacterized protein LOC107224699 [Neodiprion lecontei]
MNQPKKNTGEEPITPPPSYSTVVDERSHRYGFGIQQSSASAPYPVTMDHTETFQRMPMPMPVPMPMSMPTSMPMPMPMPMSMPMPMPESRITYESHFDDHEPRESTTTSYGIAETFSTTDHGHNRSGTDYNPAVATRVTDVSLESSFRDQTVHVFTQEQETSDYKPTLCCAFAIGLVMCGVLIAISVMIRGIRQHRL